MNGWHAILLGIVEGLTEFLPVSSTGHLILTARLLGLPQTEFMKTFEIAIQLGAILAVFVVYWRSFLLSPPVLLRVAIGTLPTAVIGFVLYRVIKEYFMAGETTVLISLFVGGIALVLFDRIHKEKESDVDSIAKISYRKAFAVGLIQSISVIPGVSRAAATIVGGLALGFKRTTIVEFSFLLAVPTIFGATLLDLLKHGSSFQNQDWTILLLGSAASFVVALVSIHFFLGYVKTKGFTVFGVYRILVAAAFWMLVK